MINKNTKNQPIRKYEILTGLTLLCFTFGIFLIGEIGIRITQFNKFGVEVDVESSSAFYKDETTGLRLIKPNQKLGKININNIGFRGPDIKKKATNGVRIIFLGSSTTYDANAPEGLNWPHQTVSHIKERYSNCSIDYINAGQPGFDTELIYTLYNKKLREYESDIVILLPGDINQDLSWLAQKQGIDTAIQDHDSELAKLSVLWAKLEKNFRVINLQRNAFNQLGKVKVDMPVLNERFRTRLISLVNALKNDGNLVYVLKIGSQLRAEQTRDQKIVAGGSALFYMPYVALQDIIQTRSSYNKVIEAASLEAGFNVLSSSLNIPANHVHYSDSIHFTVEGSTKMADSIVKELHTTQAIQALFEKNGCVQN